MKISLFILILFGFLLTIGCAKTSSQVVLQTISFPKETLTVASGANIQLTPTFTPSVFSSIDVVWATSDANVATLTGTSGVLIARNPGSAWVTVKDKNSATTGKCLIVVQ